MTAQEFKEYLDSTGLKQKELAELLGVQRSRISEWAKEDNIPLYIAKQIKLRRNIEACRKFVFDRMAEYQEDEDDPDNEIRIEELDAVLENMVFA